LNNKEGKRNIRFNLLTLITYIIGVILLLQLFNLQILNGDSYYSQATSRLVRRTVIEAPRGEILDCNGNTIVTNKMGFSLNLYKTNISSTELNDVLLRIVNLLEKNNDSYSDDFPISIAPMSFSFSNDDDKSQEKKWKKQNNFEETSNAKECFDFFIKKYSLENYNTQDARKILALRYRISQEGYSTSKPFYIAKDVCRDTVLTISEQANNFKGVNIVTEPIRDYTLENTASHIVGYVSKISNPELEKKEHDGYTGNDQIGKTGIESVLESYLRGTKGLKQIEMSADGLVVSEQTIEAASSGNNVVLTIDSSLQQTTQKALKENIEKIKSGGFASSYDAEGGCAIVMNVKTGEILALANYPDYNPNDFVNGISASNWAKYNDSKTKPMFNRAIQGAYAPGSTFKMISAIAALETKTTTIDEQILTLGRYDKAHNPTCWIYTSRNKRTHGYVNATSALKVSCNYYFYEMAYRMGIEPIAQYAKYFGLGTKTGIELPR